MYSRAALSALKAAEQAPPLVDAAAPVVVPIDAVFVPYSEWLLADIDRQIELYRKPPPPPRKARLAEAADAVADAAVTDALPAVQSLVASHAPQGSLFA